MCCHPLHPNPTAVGDLAGLKKGCDNTPVPLCGQDHMSICVRDVLRLAVWFQFFSDSPEALAVVLEWHANVDAWQLIATYCCCFLDRGRTRIGNTLMPLCDHGHLSLSFRGDLSYNSASIFC